MKNLILIILFFICNSSKSQTDGAVYYPLVNIDSSCLISKYYFSNFYSNYLDSSFTGLHPIFPILENKNIRIDNEHKLEFLDNFIRRNYNVSKFVNLVGFYPYKRVPYFGYSIKILNNGKNLLDNTIISKKSYCNNNLNTNLIETFKYKIKINFNFDDTIVNNYNKNVIILNDCFIDPCISKTTNRTFRKYIHFYSLHLFYVEVKVKERFKKGKTIKLILPYNPIIDMLGLSINIDNLKDLDVIDLSNISVYDIAKYKLFIMNYDFVDRHYCYFINIE